ncbi:bifunctional GTP diphosphokinase/guanosine-3',5'-bis pyrophosphate 3'-pyrophosphohydrolase [Xenorhabdus stockiae]|uniref:bifunctional GTP diphosphokinase/guanosine-3',5'-bis pyrophosphate 3'-pyrophosphohydrolase n=1 Tax=Xenorhabdus stockiae TaxID=351614 RepID=UPI004062B410
MYLFESLNQLVLKYLPEDQIGLLKQAYIVARDAHEGQTRSSGEPYITHPVAVACILAEMRLDHETLMAALLHDVIEDTPTTFQDIEQLFGTAVAGLVEGVSKLDKLNFRDKKEAQAENFRKMVMAMVQDIRVILIKLADRTHNMRTLGSLRPDKRRRIARETLEIYSPLAHRLGIHHLKTELEELGFEALYPNRYRVIKEVVKAARGNRKEMIQKILSEIEGRLTDAGIKCTVNGREKHLYSIYRKMHLKEQRFHSIMDIYAFRVIVDNLDTCYRVLGQMHSLYKPRPGKVKDYIAIPKANGYQSLHTSLIGPHGVPVEVQIRTEDMDQMAEMGVAAHWAYKEQGESGTTAQVRAQRWMQSLLELQQSAGSSFEFIESVKSDLFPDEIYVFTPEGRIVELPAGATPVDFAYAVHTDIGHACVGARVDRQPYPLSQTLSSGQTVEIITAPSARPNAAWLNFVVSSKARAKIRQLLKNLKRDDSVSLGRRLLNHALGNGLKVADIPEENIARELARMKLNSLDDLLAEIGLGNAMSVVVAHNLLGEKEKMPDSNSGNNNNGNNNSNNNISNNSRKLPIKGADGILITFAKCCRPIPGDPIISHISPGKGLVIHHESCRNIRGYQKEPEKFMPVEWDKDVNSDFIAEIKVDMFNHQGALANLTAAINDANSNIQSMNTEEKDGRVYCAFIRLTAKDRIQLANIMRKIRVMPDVLRVSRNRN